MTDYTDFDKLIGTWKYHGAENFENYMKQVGIGVVTRKMASIQKPTLIVSRCEDHLKLVTESTFKTLVLEFELGKEFKETTGDGREMKSIFFMENGKLIQEQKKVHSNDKDTRFERYIDENGLFVITMDSEGVVAKRTYSK